MEKNVLDTKQGYFFAAYFTIFENKEGEKTKIFSKKIDIFHVLSKYSKNVTTMLKDCLLVQMRTSLHPEIRGETKIRSLDYTNYRL